MMAGPKRVLVAVTVEGWMHPAEVEEMVDDRLEQDAYPHPATKAIDLMDEQFIESVGRSLYLESHSIYKFAKEDWAAGHANNVVWRRRAELALKALRDDLMGITE